MEEHLYTLLSGAVAFPVAWGTLGEGTSTPRAMMHRTGGLREMHLEGCGLMDSTVQIDCYGATYTEAITASRAVRSELEGYTGGPVQGVFLQSVDDGFEDDAQLLQRVRMTFQIRHND